MKQRIKFYHATDSVVANDGIERKIVVVGQLMTTKSKVMTTSSIKIKSDDNNNKPALLITHAKQCIRTFSIGYSICHPEDEFDISKGIEIAKSRLKKDPLVFIKFDVCTMPLDSFCESILATNLAIFKHNVDNMLPDAQENAELV